MMRDLLEEFNGVPVPVDEPADGEVGIDINDASDDAESGEGDLGAALLEGGKKGILGVAKMGKRGLKAVTGFIVGTGGDEDEEAAEEPRQKTDLEIFFELVSKIRQHITVVQQSTGFIREMTADMQEKTLSDTDSLQRNKMFERVIVKTNKLIGDINEAVKKIKQNNDEFARQHPDEKPLIRIRENIYGTLRKSLREAVQDYTNAQESQKSIVKEKLIRQCRYFGDIPQEKIEDALDNGESVQAFRGAIVAASEELQKGKKEDEKLQKDATQALAYVENKHNDIVTLTNSVKEVNKLFKDMEILVNNQGELIDDIEENCREASEYVEKGVENLHEANVLQKKARKKMFWLYGLILAIFGVLIVGGGLLGVFF